VWAHPSIEESDLPGLSRRPRTGRERSHSNSLLSALIAVALTAALVSCAQGVDGVPTADTPESTPPSAAHGPYVREGFFGQLGEGMSARLEIISALREPDRTALRMAFTPLDARPRSIDAFGVRGLTDSSLSGIQLLDPVGQRIYYP
jgi:hypothetical protein